MLGKPSFDFQVFPDDALLYNHQSFDMNTLVLKGVNTDANDDKKKCMLQFETI